MNNLITLLKVQFLSLFNINKIANKKKGKAKGVFGIFGVLLLFVALIIAVSYVYAKMFAETYLAIGKTSEFLPTIFAVISIICLFFSFYLSSGNIYNCKDYELLAVLPIKPHVIVISKLVFTYLADLLLAVVVLATSVVAHFEVIGAVQTMYIVRLFIMALALPAFPILISIVLGTLFSFISLRFKRKMLVQSLLYVIFITVVYVISMLKSDLSDNLGAVKNMYFLLPIVVKGVNDFVYTAVFTISSFCVLAFILIITSLTYNKLNTLLKSVKRTKNFRLLRYGQKGQFKAILQKEIRLLFSSIIYPMNTLMGSFMALAGSIVFVVLQVELQAQAIAILFATLLQALFAFSLMIAPTTAVSISVEGSSFYIMKTSPISANKLLNAKLMVNIIFGAIPALIASTIFAFTLRNENFMLIMLFILTAPLYSVLGGNVGLIMNLLFPYMKWDNVAKPVKQSLSTLFTMLIGIATAGGVFAFLYFAKIRIEIMFLLIFIFLIVSSVITYIIIVKQGEKLLNKKT